jgi:hypothetical protein
MSSKQHSKSNTSPVEYNTNDETHNILSFVKRQKTRSQTTYIQNTLCELFSNNKKTRNKLKQIENVIQIVHNDFITSQGLENNKIHTRSKCKQLNDFNKVLSSVI